MTRDWDAASYDRLPIPMTGWGVDVLGRLPLAGDERVLDAGCGSGRVTAMLLERLPHGEVVALDASPSMVDAARDRLGVERTSYLVHDLREPIPIEPVDAVLSTATFHWVTDHEALFANLAAVMRPGAPLAAQCGGRGNLATVVDAAAALGHDLLATKRYAGPEETAATMRDAGFVDVDCRLADEPVVLPEGTLEEYLRTVILGTEIATMSADEADAFVRGVAARLPGERLDYVRLNIDARRAT